MPESNILLYITAELAVLLLVITIFLFFHVGHLKKLIAKLEEKIVSLRKSLGSSRKETKDALKKLAEKEDVQAEAKDFLDYLDEEIENTKQYHQSLKPDRDIVLDITPDAPPERQVASLRHAMLIAEKEARYAGDDDNSNWDVLNSKFQQIIQFYESLQPKAEPEPELDQPVDIEEDRAEEIEAYKKRVENLERFKKLFFDMESKWEEAKSQADQYYQQLMAMGREVDAGEEFDQVLKNYSETFNDIGDLIAAGTGNESSSVTKSGDVEIINQNSDVGKIVIANEEEIQRLKNMAVDQHKVITELKKKLRGAESLEDQKAIIQQMTEQLEQQERFMKEAETCTQLIEDELSRTIKENEELRTELENTNDSGVINEETEAMMEDLVGESKQMLATIASLEEENRTLKEQLENQVGPVSDNSGDVELLQEKLSEMQQEFLNLQTQHIELEERYLELKMK